MNGFSFSGMNNIRFELNRRSVPTFGGADEVVSALHEAGHVIGGLLGLMTITSVTIRRKGDLAGETRYADLHEPGSAEEERKVWAARHLLFTLGAPIAVERLPHAIRSSDNGYERDLESLLEVRERADLDNWDELVAGCEARLKRAFAIGSYNDELDAVASGLLIHKTLIEDQL